MRSEGSAFPANGTNAGPSLVRALTWDIAFTSDKHTKTDSHTIEFPVTIPPDSEKIITYTAHYIW